MKTWLQITFLILWSGSCFLFGFLAKRAPTSINIYPAQSVTLNEGENKALKKRITKDSLYILYISHQRDSVINILKHKNETKIIYLPGFDTCNVPYVFRKWSRNKVNR